MFGTVHATIAVYFGVDTGTFRGVGHRRYGTINLVMCRILWKPTTQGIGNGAIDLGVGKVNIIDIHIPNRRWYDPLHVGIVREPNTAQIFQRCY
jgi:hypothetical protein